MTALIGKRGEKLTGPVRPDHQPDDEDYIKTLDYEELEKRFEIHKYYPKFIHNYDYSTPQIRQMLRDKPIYAKANEHVKNFKNPGTRKTFITEIDTETGQIQVHEKKTKEQAKQERREAKEARRSARKEGRENKREEEHEKRKDRQAARKEIIETRRDNHRQSREKLKNDETSISNINSDINSNGNGNNNGNNNNGVDADVNGGSRKLLRDYKSQRKSEKTAQPYVAPAIKPPSYSKATAHADAGSIQFNNPFDKKFAPVLAAHLPQEGVRSRQNSVRTMESVNSEPLKSSLGGKLRQMMRPRRSVESESLVRTSSYDQTQLMMTSTRGAKNKLLRLKDDSGRRMSHQVEVITESVNNGHTGKLESIQYTQSQMVGHGSFGVVFQTQLLPGNEIAAIKRVLQDKRFKNRELQIMKLVHHRNIVDLRYYFYTNNDKNELYLNLILEFVPETLYKASHYYVSKRLSMPSLEVKLYTYQIFRALNYIHSQGICHRDIKPQNLLINAETGVLKLCDFGSAKILNPSEPNVSYICSRYYRAPELIFGATNYTTKIDVWSAGCVMAELIVGQPLFPGESGVDQLVEIIKILGTPSREQIKSMNPNYTEYKFPQIKPIPLSKIFKKMSNDCIQFLVRVLEYSPIDRISCIEALADPYFDELRDANTKLPNYRKLFSQQFYNSSSHYPHQSNANYQLYSSQPDVRDLPELFDFDDRELSVEPSLNSTMIPEFALDRLKIIRSSSLADFVPMTPEEMKVTLE